MTSESLKTQYQQVRNQVQQLAQQVQNHRVQILAVSKVHSTAKIREAYALGARYFGENYAQELASKAEELSDLTDIRWSYIGHIQSNKIRLIVEHANEIQSLASLKHGKLIAKAADEFNKPNYPVFIAVNAEGEASKNGIPLDQVSPFVTELEAHCPSLEVQGLMCIPPRHYQDSLEKVPELYRELRNLANKVGQGRLSLGMSGDLRIAIEAGTDLVRIGTAIFGERPQKARQ
ncbi:YggS family pyridoxal phosphate-dependent enzyme [Pseudobacteriovorax antillogorgiicola]|uniref:Pyridoxal phosphate homeostasis protein n=1 Tax=Pseudobacteriovorax antillogorgiicola TaxID=1513793 RepID=A0A1Y6CQV5_9BACT|nr:YggS family pyridoxal phosphate-dependent enzyme [Pseudobacteriovorax antillogorgiicola]TCS42248.1 hypothetical protein EDD56_14219 [Pseudobacteriovorax antillogorgiicola]SMF82590.1 hypothetical protein SAMN06296036_14219 [Pseudobacteriovorax antillogorgiicola]